MIRIEDEYYTTEGDISRLMAYIAGEGNNKGREKILFMQAKGVSKSCKKAAEQMIKIQKHYGKDNKRRAYHLIVSFPEGVEEAEVIRMAGCIAEMLFTRHQVYLAVHGSTDNLHIHVGINATSYVDGKKFHMSKTEFAEFKQRIRCA